jgi:MerR family transcriptional regulator, copper efflux regulator
MCEVELMTALKIGEVAKRSGIAIETIRYYEREGLLLEPKRQPSGYRQYEIATIERLAYIRRAKELGFTLAEIRELLELSASTSEYCEHIRQQAEAKVNDIESKIRSLQKMRRSLVRLVKRCKAKNSPTRCPLFHDAKNPSAE